MTPLSWIFMLVAWAAIVCLNVFCFYNIFKNDKKKSPDDGNDS
jgi:hypothetical protein